MMNRMSKQWRQFGARVLRQLLDVGGHQVFEQGQVEAERRDAARGLGKVAAQNALLQEIDALAQREEFATLRLNVAEHAAERGGQQNARAACAVVYGFGGGVGNPVEGKIDDQIGEVPRGVIRPEFALLVPEERFIDPRQQLHWDEAE